MAHGVRIWRPDGTLILDTTTYVSKLLGNYVSTAIANTIPLPYIDVAGVPSNETVWFVTTDGMYAWISDPIGMPNRITMQIERAGSQLIYGSM